MPVTDPSATTVVELSRAEQWVLHHVLLDAIGLADGRRGVEIGPDEEDYLEVIGKLEDGTFEFTVPELERIRWTCEAHARTTDLAADQNLAAAVANRVGSTLGDRGPR